MFWDFITLYFGSFFGLVGLCLVGILLTGLLCFAVEMWKNSKPEEKPAVKDEPPAKKLCSLCAEDVYLHGVTWIPKFRILSKSPAYLDAHARGQYWEFDTCMKCFKEALLDPNGYPACVYTQKNEADEPRNNIQELTNNTGEKHEHP